MTATFYVGDAIEVMGKLPEKSVDLVLTSPPFLALRSYLPADHPDKALELGSEPNPGQYIDRLIDVVEACDRLLAPHGSMCIELADTYAGSGGGGGDYNVGGWRSGQVGAAGSMKTERKHKVDGWGPFRDEWDGKKQGGGSGWPLAKSLSLIPELFRLTLVYGTNPLTGRQTERWRLRNVVRWVRPNPPVGALGDKFRPATSELMVFCKSAKRYFDLDAVREPYAFNTLRGGTNGGENHKKRTLEAEGTGRRPTVPGDVRKLTHEGAPPLDWWKIPLQTDLSLSNLSDVPPGQRPSDHLTSAGSVKHPGQFDDIDGRGSTTNVTPELHHATGAPPLDWWNIPLLEGEEETRYGPTPRERKDGERSGTGPKHKSAEEGDGHIWWERTLINHPLGAPPLDWWEIPPGGYQGSHYAVFPPELCIKPIKAMCPEKVCRQCGEPSRRIIENLTDDRRPNAPSAAELGGYLRAHLRQPVGVVASALGIPETQASHYFRTDPGARLPDPETWQRLKAILDLGDEYDQAMTVIPAKYEGADYGNRTIPERLSGGTPPNGVPKVVPTGFSDCGHDDYRPGRVLDPFGGSGTTALVATGHGRDCILIDLDERNYELALQRVGPFILERAT